METTSTYVGLQFDGRRNIRSAERWIGTEELTVNVGRLGIVHDDGFWYTAAIWA